MRILYVVYSYIVLSAAGYIETEGRLECEMNDIESIENSNFFEQDLNM